jgi:hypothetical protein
MVVAKCIHKPRIGVVIIFGLLLPNLACTTSSEKRLFSSYSICDNLIREKYLVSSGGAHSAELYSDYITDSSTFRKYIGEHDEYGSFDYRCDGDSIHISSFKHSGTHKALVTVRSFSLRQLKKKGVFE